MVRCYIFVDDDRFQLKIRTIIIIIIMVIIIWYIDTSSESILNPDPSQGVYGRQIGTSYVVFDYREPHQLHHEGDTDDNTLLIKQTDYTHYTNHNKCR